MITSPRSRSGVLAKWKGQWLPTGGQCHWSFRKFTIINDYKEEHCVV